MEERFADHQVDKDQTASEDQAGYARSLVVAGVLNQGCVELIVDL
jgi:hypothetical protein